MRRLAAIRESTWLYLNISITLMHILRGSVIDRTPSPGHARRLIARSGCPWLA